jgi:hypothetical protein
MTTYKFPSLAELSTPSRTKQATLAAIAGLQAAGSGNYTPWGSNPLHRFHQRLRDYVNDKAIDKLNAERTDGLVDYGNKYVRNGKPFIINDSSNSPYRDFNRERIFDLFDAMHKDPETRTMPYPEVFISDDGRDYYHPGKLQEMADNVYRSKTKSIFPHVHLKLNDGWLYPEAAVHEFAHHRDIAIRGWWDWSHDITAEQEANRRLYIEDQAADHAFRINRFFHPKYRLSEDRLIKDRAYVLRANNFSYPENSYVEQMIKNPDVIGGRRRYMSLREPGGSTGWLKQFLSRPMPMREHLTLWLLTAKPPRHWGGWRGLWTG